MQEADPSKLRPSPWANLLMGVLFVTFVIALVYLGIFLYSSVRNFVATAPIPILEQVPLKSVFKPPARPPASVQTGREAGEATPAPVLMPDPEHLGRVNILLLGVDQRPGQKGPTRTDTMILLTVDPASKTVGMLSVPRDLWVRIPTTERYDKITTAHFYGEKDDYPGGGPALAMKTVEKEFGIRPHYYIKVNFAGFEKIIDLIGGIDVYVETTIDDRTFPDHDYGYDPLYIQAGQHHFNGEMALKYARTRHVDNDFGRMRRQQQVIEAIVRQVLNTGQLDVHIKNAPALWQSFQDAVETDMPLSVMLKLAPLVREINLDNVQKIVIDQSMTQSFEAENGAQALILLRDRVHPTIDAMFNVESAVDTVQLETLNGVAAENAGLVIRNGTTTGSLAARTAKYLQTQGFRILEYGPVDTGRFDYIHTVIIDYTGNPYTLQRLKQVLGLTDPQIEYPAIPDSPVDLQIILGADYKLPTMP
jgi:LCP family protein required for cell wall assembly